MDNIQIGLETVCKNSPVACTRPQVRCRRKRTEGRGEGEKSGGEEITNNNSKEKCLAIYLQDFNPSYQRGWGRKITWAQQVSSSPGNITRPCLKIKQNLNRWRAVFVIPDHHQWLNGWRKRGLYIPESTAEPWNICGDLAGSRGHRSSELGTERCCSLHVDSSAIQTWWLPGLRAQARNLGDTAAGLRLQLDRGTGSRGDQRSLGQGNMVAIVNGNRLCSVLETC